METQKVKASKMKFVTVKGTVFHRKINGKYDRYLIDIHTDYSNIVEDLVGRHVVAIIILPDGESNE
jgi:hypothetical protein